MSSERKYSTWRDYESGMCHMCHHRKMRVRKLWCEKHNYCRSCAEFLPRLRNGDFSCTRCPNFGIDPYLVSQSENLDKKNKMSHYIIDSDESDDGDLEGNNQNLDELLETLIKPSVQENNHCVKGNQEDLKPITRKMSFLHVSMPSAHNDAIEETASAQPNLICNTVAQLLHSPEKLLSRRAELQRKCATKSFCNTETVDPQKEIQPKDLTSKTTENFPVFKPDSPELERNTSPCKERLLSRRAELQRKCATKSFCNTETVYPQEEVQPKDLTSKTTENFPFFKPDSPELERNTSPCKGVRPRSCQSDSSDYSYHTISSQSETEQLRHIIGKIDGPDTSSSSSRSSSVSSNTSYDDFWDMESAK
ncbi:uncharacterized protein LOC132734400 isoform X1 [Ruditapes philippinarum]|uniref:uncharacterized protein LOC132734400 isoform X1 n=1 Tax=Ruditapes philippinarum TaxID=129788 RepID=UPI00295B4E20|nr:uncharacterized protein LOC132734400 isoform X1 [Ruditapes philippinarum]